ncbi:putative O-acyltransferase KNAG_0M00400 [Huiozyma naganishii CBS 8797]|uniref:Glycerol uptake protein 1 n=1 Tax=Huiozyma naganishii (strain ATCC MYA-139 / BCRC 22969 / CBS 8797 / KCTC 17520 / NBRC 10181 / NCYC 3082 / Yp74L-3) TaxID=1071383 RepID=J7RSJ8_HUIN7|nr:hypothetical protein KNAG_0M00400 [Kazachstania naganishii CBS 8797]CCK72893.1 hypothetical protein KNAG_0M00400 [Kazachstania naganishii CBS 8797]
MDLVTRGLRELFSVPALDARIAPQPVSPVGKGKGKKVGGGGSSSGGSVSPLGSVGAPRWGTLEFKAYFAAFAVVVPLMLRAAVRASSEVNVENFPKFSPLLSQGWLFGRKVDNSDAQYRFFRDNLLLLLSLMGGHVLLRRIVHKVVPQISRLRFDLFFGLFFLWVAHGVNAVRILLHMFTMFIVVRVLKRHRRYATAFNWVYGIGTLFINDHLRTMPLSRLASCLSFLDDDVRFRGIIPRWDVFFNFTLLRIISYNLDFLERWDTQFKTLKKTEDGDTGEDLVLERPHHRRLNSSSVSLQTIQEDDKQPPHGDSLLVNERARLEAPHHISEYNLANLVAYVLYTPLFIAGPIITFNDYVYQSKHTLPSISKRRIVSYAVRLALTILTMEFILHFTYVVAVSKTKAWTNDTPFEISMIGLFNLNAIYLKLLIPWRLFRLWALLDGVDAPENMIRMVDNNYSSLAFWRAWHRSFNKWVVRYIYIPLGGSRNRILTSLAVFSFVAVWHDIQLKLLFWGWIIVLFLIPEMLATEFCQQFRAKSWYRHLCALGAVANIWTMMIANLFGFCLGVDGTRTLLWDMFSTVRGLCFFGIASGCLFVAVQIMFELREEEKRQGIYLKC